MSGRPTDHLEPAAKKRGSDRQLTKNDVGSDSEEGSGDEGAGGTFARAPAEVLRQRKIIRARRGGSGVGGDGNAPASANPFAGVTLSATAPPSAAGSADAAAAAGTTTAAPSAAEENPFAALTAKAREEEKKEKAERAKAEAEKAEAEKAESVKEKPEEEQAEKAEAPPAATEAAAEETKEEKKGEQEKEGTAPVPPRPTFGSTSFGGGGGFGAASGGFGSTHGGFGALAKTISKGEDSGKPGFGFGFGGSGAGAGAEGEKEDADDDKEGGKEKRPTFSFGGTGGFPPTSTVFGGGSKREGDGEDKDAAAGAAGAPAAAALPLPPAAAAETGEEDEDTVFSSDGVLFEFEQPSTSGKGAEEGASSAPAAGRWKERGRGELRLNVASPRPTAADGGGDGGDGKETEPRRPSARLVMRSRGHLRLLLNANLWSGMKASRMDGGRGATFAVVNAAAAAGGGDGGGASPSAAAPAADAKLATYAFRCSSASKLDEFLAAVEEHQERAAGGERE